MVYFKPKVLRPESYHFFFHYMSGIKIKNMYMHMYTFSAM